MKIKYITGILAACIMLLSACSLHYDPLSDYSDVTVGGSDESGEGVAYKNRAEMLSQYENMYTRMRDNQEHWCLDLLLLAECHSDNAYAGTTGAEVVPFETNTIDGGNSVLERDWERYLTDIATANRIICYIDEVPDATFPQSEREQWKAEAKIYRAMILFTMARIWGDFPVITEVGEDITSENIEAVYPQYFPQQNTEEEAYEQIEKDLLEALTYAPDNTGDKTRLSKSVARALLAKVYAEKPIRDYSKVVKYCDELTAEGFRLTDNYDDLFGMNAEGTDVKMRNTVESILEIQYTSGSGNWVAWMFGRDLIDWDYQFSWAKWVTPSRDLVRAFDSAGDEIRKNEAIVYYDCNWSNYYPSNNYAFTYKYRSGVNSIIKLRMADILLLKAEALILQDAPDLAGAASIINSVRNRAGLGNLPASVTGSKENMLDALLTERRLELALEGERWFDLCRHDKVEEVMNDLNRRDTGRLPLVNPYTEYSYRLPIPQLVLDENDNLVQNPGY